MLLLLLLFFHIHVLVSLPSNISYLNKLYSSTPSAPDISVLRSYNSNVSKYIGNRKINSYP